MQVNLVFPPFALPQSPPLGIGHIKSYIEKHVSGYSVKCFDLNLLFHNGYFKSLEIGSLGAPYKIEALVRLSGEVFRGERPDLFYNRGSYDLLARACFNSLAAIHAQYSDACKSYVEEEKHSHIIDLLEQYADELLSNTPALIGFSVMMVGQLYCFLALAKLIRSKDKQVKIIVGGTLISSGIDRLIAARKEVNYVIHGEGEKPLAGLLQNLDDPSSVKGIVYKKEGSIVDTGYDYIEDLVDSPWADLSDFDLDAYYSPETCIPILSSRGCYWRKCAFCVHYHNYRDCYRVRPVRDIVEELAFYVAGGIRYFNFVDEMIPAARFKQIGETIVELGLKINYYALAKPTRHFTQDVLESMSASGCKAILWGVESANQRVLDLMDKGTVVEDVAQVLELSHLAGIKNQVFVIIGFPTETLEELQDTLRFLYESRRVVDAVHNTYFFLNKGSVIFDNPGRFGIINIYDHHLWKQWYQYDVSRGLSQSESTDLNKNLADYFSSFSAYSPFLRFFRDHALILYSTFGKEYDQFTESRVIKNPVFD